MSWAATPWRPNQTVNVNKILFYNISSQRVTHVDNDKWLFSMLRPQTFVEDLFPNTMTTSYSVGLFF